MFRKTSPEDASLHTALRQGMQRLSVPSPPKEAFDEAVMCALTTPPTPAYRWRSLRLAVPRSVRVSLSILALVLGFLAFAPQTRWIVRPQVRQVLGRASYGEKPQREPLTPEEIEALLQEERSVAERHPNDVGIQMAYALAANHLDEPVMELSRWIRAYTGEGGTDGSDSENVNSPDSPKRAYAECLRSLKVHFPRSPALYAMILIKGLQEELSDTSLLERSGTTPKTVPSVNLPALKRLLDEARTAETLDPQNAFFPLIEAYLLFRQGEATSSPEVSEAGIQALLRIGKKTTIRDYHEVIPEAKRQIAEETTEGRSVLRPILTEVFFCPYTAALREMVRKADKFAQQAEKRGETERARAIRYALIHCGEQMRSQPGTSSNVFLGISFVEMGAGIYLPEKKDTSLSSEERYTLKSRLVAQGLASTKDRPEEQRLWQVRQANLEAWHILVNSSGAYSLSDDLTHALAALFYGYLTAFLLLNGALWTLLFGVGAAWAARRPRLWEGKPVSFPVRAGIRAAVFVGVAAFLAVLLTDSLSRGMAPIPYGPYVVISALHSFLAAMFPASVVVSLILLVQGGWLFFWIGRRVGYVVTTLVTAGSAWLLVSDTVPLLGAGMMLVLLACALVPKPPQHPSHTAAANLRVSLLWFFAVPLLAGGLLFLATWQCREASFWGQGFHQMLERSDTSIYLAPALMAGYCLTPLFPLLLLVVLALNSWRQRVPVTVGMARGMRRIAAPVACALVLAYGGVVLFVRQEEERANRALEADAAQNVGEAAAARLGTTFPKPVLPPDP